MKIYKLTPQQALTLGICCLLVFQFTVIGVIAGFNQSFQSTLADDDAPALDEDLSNEDTGIPIDDISYYEQTYQPYVVSQLPDASYDEEIGIWLKGDTGNHVSDGDFTYLLYGIIPIPLPNANDKSVDEIVDMAIAEDLDFIGITNLESVKIYMPDLGITGVPSGDMVFNADLEAVRASITRARYEHPELMIFYGVEKRIGEITYFGAGQRVQCLLPYHPNQEQYWMEDLIGKTDLESILDTMSGFEGMNRELGTNFLCLNDGFLDFWSADDFQLIAESDSVGGVLSVNGDTVHEFLEMDGPNPSSTSWDYYLNQDFDFFGCAASDLYASGEGGPGANCKTYVKTWTPGYAGIMEGFALGRVFGCQNDIINGMDFNIRDEYNNIAYMGDKIISYGNQTVTLEVDANTNLQNIKLITNNGNTVHIAKTWTSADWIDDEGHLTMTYVLPHSDSPFFVRIEGSDGNGNRFFSAPVFYEKSSYIFPEITVINPPVDNYYVNTATFELQWEKTEGVGVIEINTIAGYSNPSSYEPGSGQYASSTSSKVITLYSDMWTTIQIYGQDGNGYSAYEVRHIFYRASFPVVNIISPLNNSYVNNGAINITWSAQAASGYSIDNISVWRDSQPKITGLPASTCSYIFNLLQGEYDFYVQAFQTGVYENFTAHIRVKLDLCLPDISIDSPVDSTIFNENSPEKTARKVVCSFSSYDAWGEKDKFDVKLWQNDILIDATTLDSDAYNYEVNWDDGEFLLNITAYDKAGNIRSDWITFYIDYIDPQLSLNPLFYSTSHNAYVFWDIFDTATWIDTVAITFQGETDYYASDKIDHTFDVLVDGIYSFSIWVNDSQGHSIERNSVFIVDSTPAIIYTIWIEDRYFDEHNSVFKIGIIVRDDLSELANVTLHYSLYSNPLSPLNGIIYKSGLDRSQFEIEVPRSQIFLKMDKTEWWCNISFYLECYNNVGMSSNTENFEYQISIYVEPPPDTISPFVVFGIIGAAVIASVGTGYLIFKIKRRREFGSMAKYF